MPDSANDDSRAPHTIEDGIGGTPDNQLRNAGLSASAAQMRVIPQIFDDGDHPRGQTISSGTTPRHRDPYRTRISEAGARGPCPRKGAKPSYLRD